MNPDMLIVRVTYQRAMLISQVMFPPTRRRVMQVSPIDVMV
jgi:hypothetical protein